MSTVTQNMGKIRKGAAAEEKQNVHTEAEREGAFILVLIAVAGLGHNIPNAHLSTVVIHN